MKDTNIQLAAILSAAFVALIAVLAYSGAVTEKQLQVLVITMPALIFTLTQSRKSCRMAQKRGEA